jgi:hypothetical protein
MITARKLFEDYDADGRTIIIQDMQNTRNVTLKRPCVTIFAVEKE